MGKSIYLVLDMQNDLVHADGINGKAAYGKQVQERDILTNTKSALEKARALNILIGFVRVGFSPDYRECPPSSPIFSGARKAGIFQLGTWGTEIHPDLAKRPGEFDMVKHRVSPFYSTSLDAILRAHHVEKIYCSGISTNAVVQSMVREGHDRDFEMTVLEDCCCGASTEEHENAIKGLERFCKITNSVNVIF